MLYKCQTCLSMYFFIWLQDTLPIQIEINTTVAVSLYTVCINIQFSPFSVLVGNIYFSYDTMNNIYILSVIDKKSHTIDISTFFYFIKINVKFLDFKHSILQLTYDKNNL